MDIKELSELAKTHTEAIFAEELTLSEIIALLAIIEARIYSKVYGSMGSREKTPTAAPSSAPAAKKDVPVKPAKPIQYDPVYDPAPPFDVDKPPERVNTGKVLAEPNHACLCAACNKVSYTVNRIIHDGDKVEDFLASYTPMPGIPPLTRKIEIMNVDGQISINCPHCGANKSLYLTGHVART